MGLEVYVLGTGGMMPLPHRFLTSTLVRSEGELFLFDCGEGTQVALKKAGVRWKSINVILISHTHADHITGLPGMIMLSSQVDRQQPLYLIGPPRLKEFFESMKRSLEMYVNYEVIVNEIRNPAEPQVVFENERLFIKSFPLNHTRVCVGYTLEEKMRPGVFYPNKAKELGVPLGPLWNKLQHGQSVVNENGQLVQPEQVLGPPRRGRKFAYVTDTAPNDGIVEAIQGADLLLCEGMFLKEHETDALEKKHLMGIQAAQIAKEAQVAQMGLIHYSPRNTERDLKILLKECQDIFEPTFLARDGQFINLPNLEEDS
jgi:ribonuclease Z